MIIAETGADMARFETPGRLASWTGVCPGSNESAGRIKSAHILPGNKYLKAALGTAAWHLLADGECYADPGADHFTRLDPIKAKNSAISKLKSLGFDVTITPATAA
ncbi:hypothetical protein NicSoilB8_46300 (plasmid) [Arthrobacter sp. NicSoilB8]|nr:hypothetical protein NicSoilB8_46300 [Arthrobacter sp. NicSoilB8]